MKYVVGAVVVLVGVFFLRGGTPAQLLDLVNGLLQGLADIGAGLARKAVAH